jgi:UDP-glucose 4-epimerase
MRILVTGGAGFIGANLCRELTECATVRDVIVLDNLSTGSKENLDGLDVELVVGDILDEHTTRTAVSRCDVVIHLAARPSVPRSVADPVASHEANATGTLRLLEACRHEDAHLIAASSSSVYGPTEQLPKRESMPVRPQSPYAASKLAAESYALAYGATYGLKTIAFRFFNVYGPYQSSGHAYAAVVPAFVTAAFRGQPFRIHGDGHQTRDFTYVGTLAKVLAEAATRAVCDDEPINLAFGTRTTILELAQTIASATGTPLRLTFEPPRRGDVLDSQGANDRLRALFPTIEPVELADGIQHTVDWFRRTAM